MNEAWLWILGIALAAVLLPLAGHVLRQRDFRRQVRGETPERTLPEDAPIPDGKTPDPALESLAAEAKARSVQNLVGPK